MTEAEQFDPVQLAAELRAAERTATPVRLLTERFRSFTWEDARAVALATDELRQAEGQRLIGYKLGWTSAQMRQALGIERPNWGTLWDAQVVTGPLRLDELIHAKVEPELVYRAERDIGPDSTVADIAAGRWALGLEIVDPRFPSFEFDWLDNTADNSSSARVVVGPFRSPTSPPAEIEVTFRGHGHSRVGVGSNAFGDPVDAVAWLADSLAGSATSIRAGHIVFTGGLTAPLDLAPAGDYSLEAEGLGRITLATD